MNTVKYIVKEGSRLKLSDHSTDDTGHYSEKKQAEKDLDDNIEKMRRLQDVLYAQDVYSLLIIFQAMDAAGKDSAIKHVMSGVNPQGCQVVSFKQPSSEELDHDFLWRHQRALPERGRIGIFNRSHYEEVLVVRVHREILESQHLPAEIKNDPEIWQKRYRQIREWESHLVENGTAILKFFLNVSKSEQKKRFLARIDEPSKNWKFSMTDVSERRLWDDYMRAYEEAISATSTREAPWYIIPADTKWFTRLLVSEIIVERLESMSLRYPLLDDKKKAELLEAKRQLESE